ncbi:lysophospholipid acyltransferase family protein [Williamsia herbipolensis]|uniref:1-acyl-sn-glycerol-3-phosphate acyltransferase n=1 Tax=Williamsia herbipolensis TaxID=1603258 RepID=A0AAU4K678_9NOCA|nr:lysophospholipid acyltransferase family protein [Williamsia herbipolensis]
MHAAQWWCRHVLVGPALRVWHRPRVIGGQHLRRRGAVILAANHLAACDSFHLALAARRPVFFLAKSDYFDQPGTGGALRRRFFLAVGQIRVDRSGGSGSAPALAAAQEVLTAGEAWAIHPEGTRSPDGRVHRGRTGAVRVAALTGAPIVPVAISGTVGRRWGRRRVTIRALPPIRVAPTDDVREKTDELMRMIATSVGVPYVDRYARPRSAADAAAISDH